MSKLKFTLLFLGSLMIGNASLQAAENLNTEAQVTTGEEAGTENSSAAEVDESQQPITRADFEGVRNEIAVLKDSYDRTLANNVANSLRSLKISGSLSSSYSIPTSSNASPDPIPTFSGGSATLSFKGNLKRDYAEGRNLDYVLSLATTTSGAVANYVQPTDVYIQYSIFPSLDNEQPLFYVQFGQQKKPFGLEATTNDEKKPTINGATFVSKLNVSKRDIGILLRGDISPTLDLGFNYRIPLIEYSIGIFNGSGPNGVDTNRKKDIGGRIIINAPVDYNSSYRGLSLGGSFYRGSDDITKAIGSSTIKDVGSRNLLGIDLAYVATPIGFTAEYASQESQYLSGTTTANIVKSIRKSDGYTLTVFYNFGSQFLKNARVESRQDDFWPTTYQPFVRFDHYDPDKAVSGDDTSIVTYGFNVFFAETTKLQFNYNVRNEKINNLKQNDFVVQFQYGF